MESTFVYAQETTHFNITQQEGLLSNIVYSVFQDSKGFLWITTENGLTRFNGVHFRSYENPTARSSAASNLFEDKKGRIWIHNFFGEILFVEADTLFKLNSWEKRYTSGFPSITNLGDTLLINSKNKLFYYFIDSKQWKELTLPFQILPHGSTINYNHHLVTPQGKQWFCFSTIDHTYVTPLTTKDGPSYVFDDTYKFNPNVVRLVYWKGSIWIFDSVSKLLFELNNGLIKDISVKYKETLSLTRQINNIGDSLLVFTGPKGAFVLNGTGVMRRYLPEKDVSCVTADKEGGLWLGTLTEGLFYFPNQNSFIFPKEQFGLYTKLAVDTVNQQVFAGKYSGEIVSFSFSGKVLKIIPSNVSKEVQNLYVDQEANLLFAFSDLLHVFDLKTLKEKKIINVASVKKIVKVGKQLALATSAGLFIYNPYSDKLNHIVKQRIATVVFEPTTNMLWFGSQKGLSTYDVNTHSLKRWPNDSSQYSPGVANSIWQSDNSLYLGSLTSGLYILKNEKLVRKITVNEGLSSNKISSLTTNCNVLWIGTNKGINGLHLKSNKLQTLNETKGLASEEIYDLLSIQNNLWVSNPKGLQILSSNLHINRQVPLLHIVNATTGGIIINNPEQSLTLNPNSQQLSIEFDVSNNLKSRGFTKIHYRIKELNNGNWNETLLKIPMANFLSLPFGTYTFEAFAINEDGVTSSKKLMIPIEVQAPFWKRAWFNLLLVFLLLGSVSVVINLRFKKIKEQNKLRLIHQTQEQDLQIARLTSIRAQMNPHFIFNTMSLIQSKVLSGHKEDANRNIQDFSQLIRKVLDFSGKEIIAIQDEIEVLEKYLTLEKDRFSGAFEYTITIAQEVTQELIRIPSLLTQPFVENALRHGLMHKEGEKKLEISFCLSEPYLLLTIEDNGVGRKASAEFNKARKNDHNSFALDASQKRIDLINTTRDQKIKLEIIDKYNEYGMATGTKVLIKIPIEYETRN